MWQAQTDLIVQGKKDDLGLIQLWKIKRFLWMVDNWGMSPEKRDTITASAFYYG